MIPLRIPWPAVKQNDHEIVAYVYGIARTPNFFFIDCLAMKPTVSGSAMIVFSVKRVRTMETGLWSRGGGGYLTKFCMGRLRPRSVPLPFHIPFWHERSPFYIPFIEKRYPFHIPILGSLVLVLIKGPVKYLNDRFPYPFIYLILWNSYPFLYLKPEKGTPFGRSLPV